MTIGTTSRTAGTRMALRGAAMAAVLLCATACASAAQPAPASPAAPAAQPQAAQPDGAAATPSPADIKKFRDCLKDQGVDLPDPDGMTPPTGAAQAPGNAGAAGGMQAPPGVDDATWKKATKACAGSMPAPPNGAASS